MGTEIAYQNKDIASKFLAENLKGKSFQVYGLNLPGIKEVKPTNLPAVRANELRIDNLFSLEDGTVAIVDYESGYDALDKVKYLNYLAGIAARYRTNGESCPVLRMIVIYTGDIRRQAVSCSYDIGALKMTVEAAFLSELDGDRIFPGLKEKAERGSLLSDEELMQLVILPLSYRRKEEKEKRLQEAVDLAVTLQDRRQQLFALAGLLTFTDKVIDKETAQRIKGAIEMTKVAMLFEEEKMQAVEEARKQEREKTQIEWEKARREREKARKEREKARRERERARREREKIAFQMLKMGDSPERILSIITAYSMNDIEKLMAKLEKKNG